MAGLIQAGLRIRFSKKFGYSTTKVLIKHFYHNYNIDSYVEILIPEKKVNGEFYYVGHGCMRKSDPQP